jgi:SAM-dependent methyltransferase
VFNRSADLYDALYATFKDYGAEAAQLRALLGERVPGAQSLLDVACGTGTHLAELREHYEVEGLDLDPELLAVARERLPGIPLHVGDMTDFDLGRRFDVVLNLFSSIAYAAGVEHLRAAVADRLGRGRAVHARHDKVHQNDVRLRLHAHADGLVSVAGLSHQFQVVKRQ